MPSLWFLGLFFAIAWTFFVLFERAWPDTSSAFLLPVALAVGLATAIYDQLSSDVRRKKNWPKFALFGFVMLLTGAVFAAAVNQNFYQFEPADSLSAFVLQGPALLILLNVIFDTMHRRQAAVLNGHYAATAFALKTGLVAAAVFLLAYIAYALLHKAGETHGMALVMIPFAGGVAASIIVDLMIGHPRHLRGQKG